MPAVERVGLGCPIFFRLSILFLLAFSTGAVIAPGQASDGVFDPHALPQPASIDLPLLQETGDMPDPRVQAWLDRVTPTLVYSYVAGLSGEQPVVIGGSSYLIGNRNTYGGEGIQYATQYAYERFQTMGLQAGFYVWNDGTNPDVVAEQAGSGLPQSLYLVTAHLDNKPDVGPGVPLAPGADDNASGSAGVLISAEILSQVGCYHTLRYVLFTGEEQGLLGSQAYAASVADQGIEAVLNLDMIGWNSDHDPAIDLYARDWYFDDFRIAAFFARVINAYQLNLVPEIRGERLTGSDHASFWDRGFPAILAIEDLNDFNAYYHTSNDRLSHLDLDYLTDFVKAAVGTLAHMACLAPPLVYLPLVKENPASSR